jgi:thioredoxin-like negative regulator of GroEL
MINRVTIFLLLITLASCQVNPITAGKKLVQNVTYDNFEVTVQKGNKLPYFLFFKMNKCGHCKMFEPTFYKLAYDMREEPVTFAISNIDEDSK